MSVGSHHSQGAWQKCNNQTHQKKRSTRRGKGYVDKRQICDSVNDPVHHHWMQVCTQGVHQALIHSRKAGGQCYDTWILPATHSVAKYMLEQYQEHTDQAMKLRDERQIARKNSLEPPPALPNPASDLLARLVHQLMTNDWGPTRSNYSNRSRSTSRTASPPTS